MPNGPKSASTACLTRIKNIGWRNEALSQAECCNQLFALLSYPNEILVSSRDTTNTRYPSALAQLLIRGVFVKLRKSGSRKLVVKVFGVENVYHLTDNHSTRRAITVPCRLNSNYHLKPIYISFTPSKKPSGPPMNA